VPAGVAASCRERPIRLKPGLQSSDVWLYHANCFSRWVPAGNARSG
jgi:hypothetical protein